MLLAAIAVIGPLVGVALGAYLHKRFAVSAERQGRVWDAQRAGYQVVLQKLYEVSEAADELAQHYQDDLPDETAHELGGQVSGQTAWAECRSAFLGNHFMFSDAFVEVFRTLERSLEQIERHAVYGSQMAVGQAGEFRDAYAKLERIALKDLGLNLDRTVR